MSLREIREGELHEVFTALEVAFSATGTDFYIIGAIARDVWYARDKKIIPQDQAPGLCGAGGQPGGILFSKNFGKFTHLHAQGNLKSVNCIIFPGFSVTTVLGNIITFMGNANLLPPSY